MNMGTMSHSEGIMLSKTAIKLGTGASINGRLLAQTAVNIAGSTIPLPPCKATTGLTVSEKRMSIIAWLFLGLVSGFIGSKIVNNRGQGIVRRHRRGNHRPRSLADICSTSSAREASRG